MYGGKKKAITFSYDDGVTQDIRLVEIFNRYGLKATFNLNSELLGRTGELEIKGRKVRHDKVSPSDVRSIYAGHEVAAHTLTHPSLPKITDDTEIIRQVEEDRVKLSALVGYEVIGMAYPGGGENNDARVAKLIREQTGIRYARDIKTTGIFKPYDDLYRFRGTVYHHGEWDRLFDMADRFLSAEPDDPMLFYIWGHSYEFDLYPERWAQFEAFCCKIAGREEIFYGTNREVLLFD
ncbi:MAG: polysaccharide deacetylase [Ruminococcaceae bacterium]|nr:polysaccharide deacetylase [Oscillospiraceae bacterium]